MRAIYVTLLLVVIGCFGSYRERENNFCGNDCSTDSTDSTCSEGTSCNKCVDNRCTTEAPYAPLSVAKLRAKSLASNRQLVDQR